MRGDRVFFIEWFDIDRTEWFPMPRWVYLLEEDAENALEVAKKHLAEGRFPGTATQVRKREWVRRND